MLLFSVKLVPQNSIKPEVFWPLCQNCLIKQESLLSKSLSFYQWLFFIAHSNLKRMLRGSKNIHVWPAMRALHRRSIFTFTSPYLYCILLYIYNAPLHVVSVHSAQSTDSITATVSLCFTSCSFCPLNLLWRCRRSLIFSWKCSMYKQEKGTRYEIQNKY